jgi:hypothetical protein
MFSVLMTDVEQTINYIITSSYSYNDKICDAIIDIVVCFSGFLF